MDTLIIPVIDLLDGRVVHARAGNRSEYRPLQSTLCRTAEAVDVVSALMRLHPFKILYVADLGALLGRGSHERELSALRRIFPTVTLWVDAGDTCVPASRAGRRNVIGTETGIGADALQTLRREGRDFVLSLDYSAHGFIGDASVRERPDTWPTDVIIMHLPSVGTGGGPAWPVIESVMVCRPDCSFYVAGGVRDSGDIAAAASRGIKGALVATALHTGALRMA